VNRRNLILRLWLEAAERRAVAVASRLFKRRATRIAKHWRVNSSIIVSNRKLRRSCVRTSTKS
jgi:hypothetical protein